MAYEEIHAQAEAERRAVYDVELAERDLNLQIAGVEIARVNGELLQAQRALVAAFADLEEANGDLSEALATIDTLTINLADATTALNAANARIEELEELLDGDDPDPDPDPDPDDLGQTFGASDGDWPVNGLPNTESLGAVRAFFSGGGLNSNTSWTGSAELRNAWARVKDGGWIWVSFKDNSPANLERVCQQFNTLNEQQNRDLKLIVTYRHEPENDVDDKTPPWSSAKAADIASYQAAWAAYLPVLRRNGVYSATVLLGDRVSPNNPNNEESVAYHVVGVDFVGFDRYNPGLGNANSYVSPTTVLQGVTNFALNRSEEDGKDYPLVIGEWGTPAIGSDDQGNGGDQAGRRTWARGYVARCKAIDADPDLPAVPVVCYYNSLAVSRRMRFNSDPTGQLAQIALDLE